MAQLQKVKHIMRHRDDGYAENKKTGNDMKRLKYKYQLSAVYSKPITEHRFLFRFLPADTVRQKVEESEIFIVNCHKYDMIKDKFGNSIISGNIRMQHARFDLTMTGSVITGIDIFEEKSDNSLLNDIYRCQTALTEPGGELLRFKKECGLSELGNAYEKAVFLTKNLFGMIKYDPSLTSVGDSAEQALKKGGGVCQDFAHIMLSLLRSEGISARYAAGMLYGEGSSHAWAEVLCRGYWYGFDPTNRKIVNDEYIRVSCGRDSGDCLVITGTMNGEAKQTQSEHTKVS